jgi:hypothetical protein
MNPSTLPGPIAFAALLIACSALAAFSRPAGTSALSPSPATPTIPASHTIPVDTGSIPDPVPGSAPAGQAHTLGEYPGKPAPILLSPFAPLPPSPESGSPSLGSLTPPALESETHGRMVLRVAAESAAGAAGVFIPADCAPDAPVRPVGCPDWGPAAYR